MNAIERQRFERMIAFLRTLREREFFLGSTFAALDENGITCGCVIGWTTKVFPELVRIEDGYLEAGGICMATFSEVAEIVFGIPQEIAGLLFSPCTQWRIHPCLPVASDDASPEQMTYVMRSFLKALDDGDIQLSAETTKP